MIFRKNRIGRKDSASYVSNGNKQVKNKDMGQKNKTSLTIRSMFRAMMEGGYHPTFNNNHILFDMNENIAVVEYEEGILSVRMFFTIEEDAYDLFLEASNSAMLETFGVKPVVMDDMATIMFSCETLCDNLREFRKYLPRCIELLEESVTTHKAEMKKLVNGMETISRKIPATDEWTSVTGNIKRNKIVS